MGSREMRPVADIVIEMCLAGILVLSMTRIHRLSLQSHVGLLAILSILLIGYYAGRKRETVASIARYAIPIIVTYLFFLSKNVELAITSSQGVERTIPYAIVVLSVMVIAWFIKQCLAGFPFSLEGGLFPAVFLAACIVAVTGTSLAGIVDRYYGLGFSQAVLIVSGVMQFLAVLVVATERFARRAALSRAFVYLAVLSVASVVARVVVSLH
jgi:hypothetical protein